MIEVVAAIKVVDGEAVSERKRAFGGKQNLTFYRISHSEAWVALASIE